jgi:hypothetical protein
LAWGDARGTLYHEYGHHVLYSHAESPLPDYNNGVCDESNPLAFLPFFGGHCVWNEENGSIHWTEGVPTLFSMAVGESLFPGAWNPRAMELDDGEVVTTEWPWRADGSSPSPAGQDPAQIEGWTFALLYDLFDAAEDNHDEATDPHKSGDRIQLDFDEIWAAIEVDPDPADAGHNHPVTIREFHDTMVETYPELENRINSVYTENLIAYRGADLSVSGVQLSGGLTEVTRGTAVSVEATTHNSSGARTGSDVPTRTGFDLVDTSGTAHPLQGALGVPTLGPGDSDSGTALVTVPTAISPGTYRLRACADADGVVFETGDPGTPFDEMADNCNDGPIVTVLNRAPIADAGGPYTFDEGTNPLSGAGSSDPDGDPLTYFWETATGTVSPTNAVDTEIRGLDDGVHTVQLTVSDGWDSSVDTAEITITNLPPSAKFVVGNDLFDTLDFDVDEGSTVGFDAIAYERGPDILTATIDWGDGNTDDLGTITERTIFSLSHVYTDEGNFTGELCVTDDDGGVDCVTFTVDVTNVAPTLASDPITLTGTEGSPVEATVAFSDPGDDAWTADIDFGDGATIEDVALAGRAVDLDHTYAQDGSYTGEVCVDDGDGGTDCAVVSATVSNVAPSVGAVVVDDPIIALVSMDLGATFTDPGVLDLHSATIAWGDGTQDDPASLSEPSGGSAGTVTGSHTYEALTGPATITVCVADEAAMGCRSLSVDVLSPAEALEGVIADLEASPDPAVEAVLVELNGTTSRPRGALQRLEDGDVLAATTKIAKAIADLEAATTDFEAEIRVLVLLAESIARDEYATAAALGLTSHGDLRKLAAAAQAIDDGRAAFDDARYSDAVDAYKVAIQKATALP